MFTGVETTSGQTIVFRVARSAAAAVLLEVGRARTATRRSNGASAWLRVQGLAGGTVFGPAVYADRSTDWLEIDLTRSTYAALGGQINDVAGLSRESAQSPVAMLQQLALAWCSAAPRSGSCRPTRSWS